MKKSIWVFAMVSLFLGTISLAAAFPGVMSGFGGIVIGIFLAYCGIILIAQLISAMVAVRRVLEELTGEKPVSKQVTLR